MQGLGQHRGNIAQLRTQCLEFRPAQPHGGVLIMRGIARVAQAITRAADGETLFVQQGTNAAYQQDFVVLVVATITAALYRTELREFLFPVTQHMRFDETQITHLTDGEVAFSGNRR